MSALHGINSSPPDKVFPKFVYVANERPEKLALDSICGDD
jgi:hypothetical protein